MRLERTPKKTPREITRDAGNFLRKAALDVAEEVGGEELVDEVRKTVYDRTTLIPQYTIVQLEEKHPGTGDRVYERAHKISQEYTRASIIRILTLRKPYSTDELLKEPSPDKQKNK